MKKSFWVILLTFLAASYFCVFGQGAAYFLSEYLVPIHPIYYLTAMTIIGICLYIVAGVLLFRMIPRHQAIRKNREIYLLVLFTVAPAASIWAFFVTAMWWG